MSEPRLAAEDDELGDVASDSGVFLPAGGAGFVGGRDEEEEFASDVSTCDESVALYGSLAMRGNPRRWDEEGDLRREEEELEGDDEDDENVLLPALATGTALAAHAVTPSQHFTEPPPRYSEASLVKKLEELGVGRPSTYASIISVLQNRAYVRLEQKRFVPEDRGRLVSAFLTAFFDRYVQPTFTAALEDKLRTPRQIEAVLKNDALAIEHRKT